ncbi:hypothetical protein GMES_4115 [Paraglaciecola mesophila KMM 241]|jgi:hypothetical protein|uniref:Uncharacterized protein n=1 Tax=Paraglaciecola mesophila KMM 241 TaxID=1128912 RepID=K6ZBP8_9ALTE|nr:hypothetical protein GMES_4115 [Paraglaciecola mesophila KMM 241]
MWQNNHSENRREAALVSLSVLQCLPTPSWNEFSAIGLLMRRKSVDAKYTL